MTNPIESLVFQLNQTDSGSQNQVAVNSLVDTIRREGVDSESAKAQAAVLIQRLDAPSYSVGMGANMGDTGSLASDDLDLWHEFHVKLVQEVEDWVVVDEARKHKGTIKVA